MCIDPQMFDVSAQCQGKMVEIEQHTTQTALPTNTTATISPAARGERKRPTHMMPKQNLQRFACPQCGKDYSQRKNMRRHLRLECGQEPRYPCPVCNLRFKRHNQMSGHMLARHIGKSDDKSDPSPEHNAA